MTDPISYLDLLQQDNQEAASLYNALYSAFRSEYNIGKELADIALIEALLDSTNQDGHSAGSLIKLPNPFGSGNEFFVTSTFGPRILSNALEWHNGVDLQFGGTPSVHKVFALADGIVEHVKTTGMTSVRTKHKTLPCTGKPGWLMYLHMDNIAVKEGQTVTAGQFLGMESNRGVASGAVHLHLEIRREDQIPLDPILYLNLSYAQRQQAATIEATHIAQTKGISGRVSPKVELY